MFITLATPSPTTDLRNPPTRTNIRYTETASIAFLADNKALLGMLLGEDPPRIAAISPSGSGWFLTPASLLYRTLDRLGV